MLHFKYLSNFYLDIEVNLVYDNTSSHCGKVVNKYVTEWNEDPNNACEFLLNSLIHVSQSFIKHQIQCTINNLRY